MTQIGDTDFGLQVGIGFFGKVATAVIGLVGSIILARAVGPAGYGVFYISMAIAQFCGNTLTGSATAAKKRMTESDFDSGEALGFVLLSIGAMAVLGGPLAYLFLEAVTENPTIPVAVPLLFVTISSYWSLNTLLSGMSNFSLSIWTGTVNTLAQTVAKLLLVLYGLGVWGMVGGTMAGPLLVLPILMRLIQVRPSLPSRETIRSIWEYAQWSVPNGLLGTALSRMDTVLLGLLATASAAGKYQVGLQITMPAVFISGVIGSGLMGRVSNLASRKREWIDDLWNSVSYGSILSIPIFFGSLVLSETLAVTVFGNDYRGAGVFVVGLALYRLFETQIKPFKAVLGGLDRPDLQFRISLLSFSLNVALGYGLWTVMGATGIVVATVITAAMTYGLTLWSVRRITTVEFVVTKPLLTQIFSASVMASVIYGLKSTVGLSGWEDVVLYLAIGGAIYGTLELFLSEHLRATALGIWNDFRTMRA